MGLSRIPKPRTRRLMHYLDVQVSHIYCKLKFIHSTRKLPFDTIIVLYVDEIIITGGTPKHIRKVKSNLKRESKMIDMGLFHFFIGLEI